MLQEKSNKKLKDNLLLMNKREIAMPCVKLTAAEPDVGISQEGFPQQGRTFLFDDFNEPAS